MLLSSTELTKAVVRMRKMGAGGEKTGKGAVNMGRGSVREKDPPSNPKDDKWWSSVQQ